MQTRVHELLYDSLATSGMLGLGQREDIRFTPYQDCYAELDSTTKWYRKAN
ncbi:hypothetical protein [Pseudomonas sp. Q2-TVG4-2]|uniref:hypothetical protein n=1 Tax=Pseudomonas sp. Q2-TVG4-2 TaxID=1685699 RepID=UPI0028113047|nr:hypothetical protein [Pseudomonas sp. Q2-TVG4-2]